MVSFANNFPVCLFFSKVNLLLSKFERLHFHPTNLMDVYAEQVIQNPNALTLKDIRSVLKAYSSFNHDLGDHRQQ